MIRRGEIWWADLPEPTGSGPGARRPVLVVQSDRFNASAIRTVIVVAITSNLRLAVAPGNVQLPAGESGLKRESVVNVSQLIAIDKALLSEPVRRLARDLMAAVADGLKQVLAIE